MGLFFKRFRHTNYKGYPKTLRKDLLYYLFHYLTVSDYHPYSTYLFRSTFIVGEERKRHYKICRYVIHPLSLFRLFWQLLMIFVWGAATMLIIFIASFLSRLERENYDYEPILTGMLWLNCTCIVDIVVNFFTGYFDGNNFVLHPKKIAIHYLKTFFLVDIFVIFHFIAIYILPRPISPFKFQVIYSLQFIRVIRVYTKLKYISVVLSLFRFEPLNIDHIKKIILITYYIHFSACIMCYIPEFKRFIYGDYSKHSWVIKVQSFYDAQQEHFSSIELYLKSVLNVLWRYNCYLIDIELPIEETILHTFIIICTTSILAYLFMEQIYTTNLLFLSTTTYTNFVAETKHFMEKENLSEEIQKEIEESFQFNFNNEFYQEDLVLENLLINVQHNIHNIVRNTVIKRSEIFRTLTEDILKDIVDNLKWFCLVQGSKMNITKTNNIVLFIIFGALAKYVGDKEIQHYYDTEAIDEIHPEDGLHIVALENSYMASIPSEEFNDTLNRSDIHEQKRKRKSSLLYS